MLYIVWMTYKFLIITKSISYNSHDMDIGEKFGTFWREIRNFLARNSELSGEKYKKIVNNFLCLLTLC